MIKWRGIIWSIHPLFVLVMAASFLTGYLVELATLFLLVLVHEIGHVVVARGLDWKVREVKLLPFGGVAEVEDEGSMPSSEEALVAIAGPLQNVWMGAAAWLLGRLGWWDDGWAHYVVNANLMIGCFNLLPIYPLDGGKLLRALLSKWLTYYSMMIWTSRISLALSALMLLASFAPLIWQGQGMQLNLLAIALFLWLTNWSYYRHIPFLFFRFLMHRDRVALDRLQHGTKARPIMASGRHSLLHVAKQFWRDRYHYIYLRSSTGVEQVLPEQQIVERILSERNPHRPMMELFLP
ncbi:M50 family metallopeptidase [Paenibacillus protaetiae]|uniref:Zn-dependent protease n=1 Tax=Paenibacillus protaetiae TaxID=2509456 RepID=A0A4P6EX47_9BACL|nr:M50 family metallopeptidase [Paenibacillus protaetiae]QAY65167.1 Zn-dependent protease [Paenibacillus protaetiae]